ncbi:MAG: diguanylate cyclase [Candidatus Omnitrophica bacterium]|nr:diguanylate cyclase [Candidatus Omnitrophota bacterium]
MKEKSFLKRLSLLPYGLRYKLLIAFSLMSVIPLLVIGYIVNNFILFDGEISLGQISTMVLFSIAIAWLGLFLAKGIVERVIDVALETKIIREGNFERKVPVGTEDEIGEIGEAINFLTKKIRDNIMDLKDYQEKMKEINAEIQKRVSVLSNVLQIGELISSSVKLDSIIEIVLLKIAQLYDGGFAALYFSDEPDKPLTVRLSQNLVNENLLTATIESGSGLLGKAMLKKKHIVMDASSKFSRENQEFKEKYKCENIVIFPLFTIRDVKALLVTGNGIKNFTYTNDDVEIIKVFTEQIAIAIENDVLMKTAEKLQIKDQLTGLFNKDFMKRRLNEEIQRSFISHRPCSFILLDIDDFKKYETEKGKAQAAVALKKIGHLITELSGPLGKAGRFDKDLFALIMPEVNKKAVLQIAEKIRKRVEKMQLSEEKGNTLTVSCGVSENPLDGPTANEILEKAQAALGKAKEEGKNKIIGAGV